MRRATAATVLFLVCSASAACRVEQTPDEYIDHQGSIQDVRREAGAEVRDRLLAFVSSAGRGDAAQALLSLHPAANVDIVGPEGLSVAGAAGVRTLIAGLVRTPVSLQVHEIEVETGPAGDVAWFRMVIEAPGTTAEPSLYQATGTYLNDAGLWELVQAHIAGPVTSDSSSSTSSQRDSAATPAEAG